MKILRIIILVVILTLTLGSGLAKVMLIPEEAAFFNSVGLNDRLIILFGAIQLISIIILLSKKWWKLGAIILVTTFGFSTILLFLDNKTTFGLFSILPILLIVILVKI